ncbi:hypothetical protein [Salimicrobium halophilum]|uniref:Uncharacterized protein n=1 Tax=Salimicrobium halophilum TaxID=86666 RepID=A0A1G8S193_9BACI|nr:hypothetical protein [Salimicrobium halophilum]SDJ23034.1 hypothetical protein SAMN04490247_1202 [Salimicrobium halophilum]
MRRIVYLFMILSLSIIVAACSGNDVENADNLEGSDKSAEEKEMQEGEGSDATGEATSSDSDNNNDSASGEDSSDTGESSGEGETSGSESESDSGNTNSGDSSSDASGADSSTNSSENSSDDGETNEGSEGSSEGETEETPTEDGNVNGTPRSEEELNEATQYTFSEVNGQAVEVLMGFTAVEINVGDIPEAGKNAEVYMMIDDGQIIDLSYDKEREAFRNGQIKQVSKQALQSATVFVSA